MDLDDRDRFKQIDADDMLGHIDALPEQLSDAWAHGHTLALRPLRGSVRQIFICGMGGSAISGDLLAALTAETLLLPIFVNRSYTLPPHAAGPETLVIGLSHSGGTEETLSAVEQGIRRGAQTLAITTGGQLAEMVDRAGGSIISYQYPSQPRAALGWLYGLLLAALDRFGIVNLEHDIRETVDLMRRVRDELKADVPIVHNPAKRLAGQLMGRVVVVWGAGLLEPVARRWKTQINENAKTAAYYEGLPELNHNSIVGTIYPEDGVRRLGVVQLISRRHDHPRVQLRQDATGDLLLQEAILNDRVYAAGESRLANQLSLIQYGDYVSYYLAMSYGVDPTPIPQIVALKARMAETGQ